MGKQFEDYEIKIAGDKGIGIFCKKDIKVGNILPFIGWIDKENLYPNKNSQIERDVNGKWKKYTLCGPVSIINHDCRSPYTFCFYDYLETEKEKEIIKNYFGKFYTAIPEDVCFLIDRRHFGNVQSRLLDTKAQNKLPKTKTQFKKGEEVTVYYSKKPFKNCKCKSCSDIVVIDV